MTIVNPFVHCEPQLADALQALPAVPTLLHAIKRYESRPFRIISHECEDGKLFNCAFFDSKADMSAYKAWYTACALTEGGKFYGPLSTAFADQSDMPTPETWLWGSGLEVLSDSRFGEYQLGMAVRYSRMVFRDEAAKQEAERAALSTEFGAPSHARTLASTLTSHTTATAASTEQRIAEGMNSAGVSYFGRLVTRGEGSAEGHQWISATRYGSVEDAHRGTAAVKEMLAPELAKWFVSYESIIGTAVRVLEM